MKKVLKFPELNAKVIIKHDESPSSPREDFDQLGVMVCFHGKYNLGDKHSYYSDEHNGWEELKKAIMKRENAVAILPLYLYDHSGQTMNTTGFSCSWDSGQVGWIYMTKKEAVESWGKKKYTKQVHEKALACLEAEVKEYDQYLRGEIYGFKVKTLDTKEEKDSCWGFYEDIVDNGIFDHLNIEGLTFERYQEVFNNASWV
jgi:hypothetical protein